MELSCPTCKSDQTQKITAIVDAGTTRSVGKTSTIGVASAGRGIGVGGAVSTTRNTSTTDLAKKLATPKKRFSSVWLGFIPLMLFGGWIPYNIAASFFHNVTLSNIAGFIALAGTGYVAFKVINKKAIEGKQYNTSVYPKELQTWQDGFFCHRCEHTFIPSN